MSKKILFNIYGLDRGGPEMRLLDFARYFPDDCEIHICVTSNDLSLIKDFKKTNAKIFVIPIDRVYFEFSNVNKLLRYIRDNEIQVLNSFDIKGLIISALAKIFYGRKVTVVHHFIDLLHNYKSYHKQALWILLKFADLIICNSNVVRNEVIGSRSLNAKVDVIHNGVDTDHFFPCPERRLTDRPLLGLDGSHFVLGTVANFRPEKNYPYLIDCFRQLSSKHSHLRLLCVGGGPLLRDVKEMVREYKLSDRVIFTDYVEDVRRYLGLMDAFALCGLNEGFPNAVIQAMSMGLPVIASAVGESKKIITDGETGLLFDPNGQQPFLAAVNRIVEDQDFRKSLSEKGRELVEHQFSLSRMLAQYIEFYRNI